MMSENSEVVVCGAGPIGLIAALKFAQAGLEVTVIDADKQINDSPRACIYMPASLEGFDSIGILDDVRKIAYTNRSSGQYSPAYNWMCQVPAPSLDAGPYANVLHVGQEEIGAVLVKHLEQFKNARILWNTRLKDFDQNEDKVTLQVETATGVESMVTNWLIGSDGANSTVRKLAGIEFAGHTWPDRFFASNVTFDFNQIGLADANFRMDPHSWAVIVRVNKAGVWRIAFGEDGSLPYEGCVERATARLNEFIPEGEKYDLLRLNPYTVHQRAGETLRKGRVLLAGDAAHATNPIGGLGLSTHFWHALILGDLLPSIIKGETPTDALDAYSKERLRIYWEHTSPMASENKRMVQEADPMKRRADMNMIEKMAESPELVAAMQLASYRFIGDPILENSRWAKYKNSITP
jgi:2-polyprenyl-6-methoxyphenol hydroxylase-like FAD-dependent oxidoreductase